MIQYHQQVTLLNHNQVTTEFILLYSQELPYQICKYLQIYYIIFDVNLDLNFKKYSLLEIYITNYIQIKTELVYHSPNCQTI